MARELVNLESIPWLLITINVLDVYKSRSIIVLRRARSITRGIGMGGPWKSRLFWALKWLRAKHVSCKGQNGTRFAGSHFWAQKSLDSQGPPFPVPQVMDLPASKPLSISSISSDVAICEQRKARWIRSKELSGYWQRVENCLLYNIRSSYTVWLVTSQNGWMGIVRSSDKAGNLQRIK